MEDIKHPDPGFGLGLPVQDRKVPELLIPLAPVIPTADVKVPEHDVKVPEPAALPVLNAMSDKQHQALRLAFPVLAPNVDQLMARGKTRSEAWVLCGAIEAYTGIADIDPRILKAVGVGSNVYPKVVGQINNALRGGAGSGNLAQNQALATVFKGLNAFPDYRPWRWEHPTRMMDAYATIDTDYTVGNVVIMAEVGSVSKKGPEASYYARKYRLHFDGGLKDISHINPQQQELVYAPGTAYLVTEVRVGKANKSKTITKEGVKEKLTGIQHTHIYLRKIQPTDAAYPTSAAKIKDMRSPSYRPYT